MKILLLMMTLLAQLDSIAQNDDLKKIYVNEYVSTHLICSEPVQYIDISTEVVVGDLPLSNVVRIKPLTKKVGHLGVLTIVTSSYLVQYEMLYITPADADRQITIKEADAHSLLLDEVNLTYEEMRTLCSRLLQSKKIKQIKSSKAYGIQALLNQVYTVGDYYLIDMSVKNKTNIPYDIDQIRFKIADKKITKATNFQEVEIKPEYQFYGVDSFEKKYRNVFVFKKFTYPNKKVFSIELAEKQISGRNIKLEIDYKEVLNADTF